MVDLVQQSPNEVQNNISWNLLPAVTSHGPVAAVPILSAVYFNRGGLKSGLRNKDCSYRGTSFIMGGTLELIARLS